MVLPTCITQIGDLHLEPFLKLRPLVKHQLSVKCIKQLFRRLRFLLLILYPGLLVLLLQLFFTLLLPFLHLSAQILALVLV